MLRKETFLGNNGMVTVIRFFFYLYLFCSFLRCEVNAEPSVFLTVSSLAVHPHTQDRRLELNWHELPDHTSSDDAWIRLFSHEPGENDTNYLVQVHPGYHTKGHYRTSIRFPEQVFNSNNLTDVCLGFWIAYVDEGRSIISSCIRARPNWMYELRGLLANVSMSDLVIPGTHNAACYGRYNPSDDTLLKRYLYTQEETVWNQLVYGVRYLDLRVSHDRISGTADRFWITHSVFTTGVSVRQVISQVKAFLNATNEIVIMDFHRFVNGFGGRRARQKHRLLISLLEGELSEYMVPVSATPRVSLGELWAMNRRLLVGYASDTERRRSPYMHPAVKHLWGDKDRTDALFMYLNESVCGHKTQGLTSAMVQLTPSTAGTLFDIYGGVRKMADDVNRYVAKWLRELWWHCANIIATDYFLGSNIIETSIDINKKKFST